MGSSVTVQFFCNSLAADWMFFEQFAASLCGAFLMFMFVSLPLLHLGGQHRNHTRLLLHCMSVSLFAFFVLSVLACWCFDVHLGSCVIGMYIVDSLCLVIEHVEVLMQTDTKAAGGTAETECRQ